VLSSISYYLAIDNAAYLTEVELDAPDYDSRWNATQHGKVERIPRILHQTWKSETLPTEWTGISQACREMMPDYEYMLWTDTSSREFIAESYPWFLNTFDAYTYPIQRADAIRYFILHHYGGVYLDLDVGCLRPLDSLLVHPVILPKTIPVGVSNDLMFSEKGHPFMAQTIHNLVTFDHSWVLNYPTVMFSTGPMFLSAQYGLYTASHPPNADGVGEVRILPKALYGKNAKPAEAPHAFFSHYYGSSWHADDAAFIGFLGKWGKGLMVVGAIILVLGLIRLTIPSHKRRRLAGYDVVMPRWTLRNGRWFLDLGFFAVPASGSITTPTSPVDSPIGGSSQLPLLPLQLDVRSASPAPSDMTSLAEVLPSGPVDLVRRVASRVMSYFGGSQLEYSSAHSPHLRRSRPPRGVLYFLPAIFSPNLDSATPSRRTSPFHSRTSSASPLLPEKDEDRLLPDIPPFSRSGRRSGRSSIDDPYSDDGESSSSAWGS